MENKRYPKIHIGSKNELAKRLSNKKFPIESTLLLINDVKDNFNNYWRDNPQESEPLKEKYVRSSKRTPLGRLLGNINEKILAPNDKIMPIFIFGGIKNSNHLKAAEHLLGKKRYRTLLKLDIKRFFEQVNKEKVVDLFRRCNCSKKAAVLISSFCCVPTGPKGSTSKNLTIARGFATSSRIAVWCNLDIFIKLNRLVKKRLKGKDPRIAIYVDDIGITASRATEEEMWSLSTEIKSVFEKEGLILHKIHVISHSKNPEHLGVKLLRNRLSIGNKTKSKIKRLENKLEKNIPIEEKTVTRKKLRSLMYYKRYVEGHKLKS